MSTAAKNSKPAAADPIVDDEKDEGVAAPTEVADEQANDAATGLNASGEPLERYGFDILANIKQAQLQNGLRHGDYQRYRQYCARRLRRLRVGLKFTHHKREFKAKTIEASEVNDVRYLALPLVAAERCWSYAMQLKNDMSKETQRKRFHLLKRLTKAVTWANSLVTLCETRADTRTQLQAQAYAFWMGGSILFERSQHEKALAKFLSAKTVYEKLGSIGGSAMQILCEERVASLADSIRFCKYMLRNKSGGDDDEDVSALDGGHDDLLSAKLEELRRERMLLAAQTLDTIEWQGKVVPVSNEKLRLCFVEAKTLREQLDKALAAQPSADASAAAASADKKSLDSANDGAPESQNLSLLYQKLFGSYDESLKVLRDALLEPKMLEAHKAHLLALQSYSTASRLEVQTLRNSQFIASLVANLKLQQRSPELFRTRRKTKPDEVVLLYEKIAAATQELQEIQTQGKNTAQAKILGRKLLGVQSGRLFYLAESYRRLKKYVEAWLLYTRSLELLSEYQAGGAVAPQDEVVGLDTLRKDALFAKGTVHAQALLEEAEKQAKLVKSVATIKIDDAPVASSSAAAPAPARDLISRLDQWDSGDAAQGHQLLSFPPEFQAAPTKPILFDLAFNAIQYPDITRKIKEIEAKKVASTPAPAAAAAAAPAAAPAKKAASAPKKEEVVEAAPSEEEYPSLPSSAPKAKAAPQPQVKKVIAPPGEKESVKRERERLAQEEEERKKKAEEDAKKAKGWGIGGLLGKVWGR